jgi:hypothetical protein
LAYAAPLGTAVALGRWFRGARADDAGPLALVAAALWASCLYRPDPIHIYWSVPLAALIAFRVAIGAGPAWGRVARWASAWAAAAAILADAPHAAGLEPFQTRRGRLLADRGDPVRAWIETVEAHAPPGGRAVIFPYASGLYFYCDVRNATRYEIIAPLVPSPSAEMDRLVAALEADPPDFIFDNWIPYVVSAPSFWPHIPPESYAAHPLAGVIRGRYEPAAFQDGLIVWRRRRTMES